MEKHHKSAIKKVVFSAAVLSTLIAAPALATDTDAIDKLKTGADKIGTVTTATIPFAVSSIVFAGGALMIKRLIYA